MAAGKDERGESSTNTRKITAYPFEDTLQELAVIAEQRRREKDTDLLRRSAHVGSLFVAISEEPGANGLYGTRTTEMLAKLIRPYVVLAIDWLQEHGSPIRFTNGDTSTLSAFLEIVARGGLALPNDMSPSPTPVVSPPAPSVTEEQGTTGVQSFFLDESIQNDLNLTDNDIL